MTLIWARDKYYMAYAIGTVDLDAWDHNRAALIAADLNALDWFHHASIIHTKPIYKEVNPMTASHYPKRIQTGRKRGRLATTHYFQTAILTYAAMGACTTSHNGAEVTTVKCVAGSALTAADYFFINCIEANNYIWFTVDGGGADPTPGGIAIGPCVVLSTDTPAEIAGKLKTTMNAGNYGATVATDTVTITNVSTGAVVDASDGNTDFTIAITTQGTDNHAITKATDENPIRLAFHYKKEGGTAQRRKDMEGFIPGMMKISVSENSPIAMQTYTGQFVYTGPGDDLAQPTAHAQYLLAPFSWYDYKHASGASAFTYNSGDINVDIVDIVMKFGWTGALFGAYSGYYPSNGLVQPPFIGEVELGVRLTDAGGTGIDTISDLRAVASAEGAAEYDGDLDFIADFYRSATIYNKYTWDKMMIDPDSYEEVFMSEGEWFDGCRFTLKFLNENSSLAVEEKNPLSKIYYEND
ncbi:MAG: major tail protein [Lokiarchaeia virus VerdaV4]|uniref:Major tail protein n=1 Tax=Lokiarchaeia virus VerdaV4 TaxID=3070172 RepID=A0AA35CPI9_9CAUD|nr:MAG: major tail protein [Lokiarchaeia virus VerdaV4]BDI54970.1 MAG: major tail protein [Lokiarchaeia virus VerdaV4]